MEQQTPQTQSKFSHWLKTSITARMIMVGLLIIILLIPLSYINNLIEERSFRQQDVVNEINDKWGNEVLVYGPIIKIPYKTYKEISTFNEKTKLYVKEIETHIKHAYIFPKTLDAKTNVTSKSLYRGNFESAVFTADMKLSGEYVSPQLNLKGIEDKDVLWDKATVLVKTSNLKGIKDEVSFKLDKTTYAFETNFNNNSKNNEYGDYVVLDELESGILKDFDLSKNKTASFNLNISFNGSNKLRLIPVGKTTTMSMTSNWADPSFTGEFLPNDETRKITKEGFSADWKVLHINRAFSQQYLNSLPDLNKYAFGTEFIVLVDEYQKSERSAKYGFLVIALTFLVFFLIQTISKINIHPFQYLMIGLALVMFYTLLVSISEHSNFLKAYLIAGASVITLISFYSKAILKKIKFPLFIGVSLTALYTFIYVIIQLENYALLVGSIGLFVILGIIMFISRKIDWENAS